jgi:hypothetical protein
MERYDYRRSGQHRGHHRREAVEREVAVDDVGPHAKHAQERSRHHDEEPPRGATHLPDHPGLTEPHGRDVPRGRLDDDVVPVRPERVDEPAQVARRTTGHFVERGQAHDEDRQRRTPRARGIATAAQSRPSQRRAYSASICAATAAGE